MASRSRKAPWTAPWAETSAGKSITTSKAAKNGDRTFRILNKLSNSFPEAIGSL
jgi:hypothetical protein